MAAINYRIATLNHNFLTFFPRTNCKLRIHKNCSKKHLSLTTHTEFRSNFSSTYSSYISFYFILYLSWNSWFFLHILHRHLTSSRDFILPFPIHSVDFDGKKSFISFQKLMRNLRKSWAKVCVKFSTFLSEEIIFFSKFSVHFQSGFPRVKKWRTYSFCT